ncbi:MAG: Spy/CpxP family protein refolding chaperone [Caulobacterales bacterium]|nr:Spy/CpxP family protein refolding chaperone [Caulobacterales bacterium]
MNRRLILGLAPIAAALATVASAQPPAPHHDAGPPEMHHADMKAMHEAMMKQHLEDLKIVLRLRPDQEAALQAFAAAHHPPEMGEMMHDKMFGGPEAKPMTTPERLDEMAKHEAAMAAEHQKMTQALKTFYAALSPDQQKVFDALQRLEGPGGMHGGHHMVMMGGPGMMMGGPGMGPPGMDGPHMMIMHRQAGAPGPGDDQ